MLKSLHYSSIRVLPRLKHSQLYYTRPAQRYSIFKSCVTTQQSSLNLKQNNMIMVHMLFHQGLLLTLGRHFAFQSVLSYQFNFSTIWKLLENGNTQNYVTQGQLTDQDHLIISQELTEGLEPHQEHFIAQLPSHHPL